MSQSPLDQYSEKLFTFLKKVKELLSKDYSVQDLKNLKSLPKTLKEKLSEVQGGLSKTSASSELITSSTTQFDIKKLLLLAREFLIQRRSLFILLLLILLVLLINRFVVAPYSQRVQDQLDMRPAQWSQLQSLIKQAKSYSPSASQAPSYGGGGVATVTLLDDMELQKIRGVMSSRGLKPTILRLTADNPPRIEFQSSDAMFSVLLEVLDEIRTAWRLYPEQLNVVSTTGAGIVNISGVLVQHGGQAGMTQ